VTKAAGVKAACVVVPAHNEEELLPACLSALRRAACAVSVPVYVLVVADACGDGTAATARACGVRVIRLGARNVGAARAAGMSELLRLTAARDRSAVWLATTDADTVVPSDWLRRQLSYASQGWDVVLGTVTVPDWDGHPPHVPAAFDALYELGDGGHPHVHGANLGIRASAYLAAGGFSALRTAEDHALVAAATEAGCSVLQAGDISVETSGRRHARAPLGFSHVLRTLAALPQPRLPPPCPHEHLEFAGDSDATVSETSCSPFPVRSRWHRRRRSGPACLAWTAYYQVAIQELHEQAQCADECGWTSLMLAEHHHPLSGAPRWRPSWPNSAHPSRLWRPRPVRFSPLPSCPSASPSRPSGPASTRRSGGRAGMWVTRWPRSAEHPPVTTR
jgi:hypothetical protein